jgi:hypothetical protein
MLTKFREFFVNFCFEPILNNSSTELKFTHGIRISTEQNFKKNFREDSTDCPKPQDKIIRRKGLPETVLCEHPEKNRPGRVNLH